MTRPAVQCSQTFPLPSTSPVYFLPEQHATHSGVGDAEGLVGGVLDEGGEGREETEPGALGVRQVVLR